MFDDNRDLNRDLGRRDAYLDNAPREGFGYGPIVALVAIALIIGGLFMFAPSNDRVASNNSPTTTTTTRSTPAPAPAPVTPAPPATAPKQ
jgi:hypothetical protein